MTEPVPVLLDVDTGVDDACALLLAALHPDALHADAELRGWLRTVNVAVP